MKNKEQIFSQLENEFLQARLHLANLKEMLKILKENIDYFGKTLKLSIDEKKVLEFVHVC